MFLVLFMYFVWVRQPEDVDYVISIEYYSELLNHVSKNWEVLVRKKLTDKFGISILLAYFSDKNIPFFKT